MNSRDCFAFCREYGGQLVGAARWLLLLLVAYAVFLSVLFAVDATKARLDRVLQDNPLVTTSIGQETWHAFPPGVQLDQLVLHPKHGATGTRAPIVLQQVRVSFSLTGLFPPRPCVHITSTGLGGTLKVDVIPNALIQPTAFQITADWNRLALPLLLTALQSASAGRTSAGGTSAGDIQIHAGTLSGSLSGVFPVASLLDGNGTLSGTVTGAEAALTLPFFRPETLEQANGQLDLHWKNNTVTLENLVLRSTLVQGQMTGSLRVHPANPATSDMSVRVALTVAPEQLRLELLPARTRTAFTTRGQATVRISGTPAAPMFALE